MRGCVTPRDQVTWPTRIVHFAGAKSKPWKFPEVIAASAAWSAAAASAAAATSNGDADGTAGSDGSDGSGGSGGSDGSGGSGGNGGRSHFNMSTSVPPAVREWARRSRDVERRIRLNLPPLHMARPRAMPRAVDTPSQAAAQPPVPTHSRPRTSIRSQQRQLERPAITGAVEQPSRRAGVLPHS